MRQAILYRYRLPLKAGVVLRHQRLKTRDGLLLCLCEDGQQGWGEIAPLPEFSQETLAEVQRATISLLSQWLIGDFPLPTLPSLAFGFSCAQAELAGELPPYADYRTVPLCHGDPDLLFNQLQALPGEKIAKVKVGLYEVVRDGMVVNMLLDAVPDLQLRLDANRSWSREKAQDFAKYINPVSRSRIVFIEEPCHTRAESLDFAQTTGMKIAWDESVREADFCIGAQMGVAAIVIKPTLTGSLHTCQQLIRQAHQAGLVAVISSSIESSLGLNQLARIAAWLTPNTVPGLDTLSLMQVQLVRPWPKSDLPLYSVQHLERVWQG